MYSFAQYPNAIAMLYSTYNISTIRNLSSVRPANVLFSKVATRLITESVSNGGSKLNLVLKNAMAFTI